MRALRSLSFNILFYLWSGLVHVASLPCLLVPSPALIRAARIWVRVTFVLLAGLCRLRHEVRGLDNLPREPCIIASKHQSAWDTLVYCLLVDGPGFVVKRELLWIPLYGWYIRHAGCIPIDREGGAAALKTMIREARRALERGRYIVIFPEGTRVAPGARRPYHPGVAALYSQLEVPVVPAALNSGLFWGRRAFHKKPGRIVVEFLEPIAPGLSRPEFMATLEHRLEAASARLLADTPA